MSNFSEQTIEELQKTLSSGVVDKFDVPGAMAILSSKSISKLGIILMPSI